jgi:hypothetical protein
MSKETVITKAGQIVLQQAAAPAKAPGKSAEDIKAEIEAMLQAAYEEALTRPKPQQADPGPPFEWDVFGFGPIQVGTGAFPFTGPPYLPHQVVRVGETAFIVTILLFGPVVTGVLTPFLLPVEVRYNTGNLTTWSLGPANLQQVNNLNLINGLPFLVDVFGFTATTPGTYEMNIRARIQDAGGGNTPPFAGFARRIQKIDPGLFFPEPGVTFDTGLKFEVYV